MSSRREQHIHPRIPLWMIEHNRYEKTARYVLKQIQYSSSPPWNRCLESWEPRELQELQWWQSLVVLVEVSLISSSNAFLCQAHDTVALVDAPIFLYRWVWRISYSHHKCLHIRNSISTRTDNKLLKSVLEGHIFFNSGFSALQLQSERLSQLRPSQEQSFSSKVWWLFSTS